MEIRNYNPDRDYESVKNLYQDSSTFGGQFDEARDTEIKLRKLIEEKPESILVAEVNKKIIGTVTLFEDGRSAWLYRFAVQSDFGKEASEKLWKQAKVILKKKGHNQILVYAPSDNSFLEERYIENGFNKGNNYTAYWQEI